MAMSVREKSSHEDPPAVERGIRRLEAELRAVRAQLKAAVEQYESSNAALHAALEELEGARAYAERIVDTVREPLVVLNTDLRVVSANRAFYDAFSMDREQTEGRRIYELGNDQWDIPRLRELLEEVLPEEGASRDFEIEHPFERIGRRTMLLNARRIDAQGLIFLAIEDISRRKKVERQLEEEKELVRLYLDVAGVIMVALDRTGCVTLINQTGCQVLGYARDEILGKDWFAHFLPARERASVRSVFDAMVAGEVDPVEHYENAVLTRSGEERMILWHNAVIRNDAGDVLNTLGSGADITERKRAREALSESERRFRSLFAFSPDAIFVEDAEGQVLDVNPAACLLHDTDRDTLIGMNVRDLVPPDQRETSRRNFERLLSGEIDYLQSYSWTIDRHTVPVEIRANRFIYDGDGAILLIVRDISDRRRLEREVLRISEDERRRIGKDIHDVLASQFSGIALLGRGLVNQLKTRQQVDADMLEEIARLARTGAGQARALARGLSPVSLDKEGLKAALQELALSVETRSGTLCALDLDDTLPGLDSDVATQLYRIAQEAVTNAVKHAGATHLEVRVCRVDQRLVLTVRDEGAGLPEDLTASGGMGLHIMPYRARMIGATFEIDSTPGAGTTVTCTLPLTLVSPNQNV